MTSAQETCIMFPLALLMLSQSAFGQNNLDLEEADARDAAYKIMSAAKERFDCKLEEYTMQDVGNEPDVRYIFHVTTEGNECLDALLFATNMAARADKIMFRQVQVPDSNQQIGLLRCQNHVTCDGQTLIHEVNPEIDDKKRPEQ